MSLDINTHRELMPDHINKLEAEVERLKKQRDEAIRIAMKALRPELLLDGSFESKVDLLVKIEKLQCANLLEEAEKLQTLPEKLDKAIEIAKDAIWYARIYENEMHFDKIDMLYQKLVALKNDQ